MSSKFNGVIFKDKKKVRQNFNSVETGTLVKIFIPSVFRGIIFPREIVFVYGITLGKHTDFYRNHIEHSIRILIETDIYVFIWRSNEAGNGFLVCVKRITGSEDVLGQQ